MTTDQTEITCIVTIHGIGFQQPPAEGVDGYADDLHAHLCTALNQNGNVLLSDDPDHRGYQRSESVPIYVRSIPPGRPKSFHEEEGLLRLGEWNQQRTAINHDRTENPNQALVKDNARIAHVALVYSELEGESPQPIAAIEAIIMTLNYLKHYTNFMGLLKTVLRDIQPLLFSIYAKLTKQEQPLKRALTPSLRVRQDKGYRHRIKTPRHPSGLLALLRQLENDVAAYVYHNELRQRIRGFVRDALLRLAFRGDVSRIILNTHSNGTLIALDALQELPPLPAQKIRAIITAGSPIRKYVDLFKWGTYLTVDPMVVEHWMNFYDERDIVADPLLPHAIWQQGTKVRKKDLTGIYHILNESSGDTGPIPIVDQQVDNIKNSQGGGLQAHNYWDNTKDFIPRVADIVRSVHNTIPIV